jgi:hypothetical protein
MAYTAITTTEIESGGPTTTTLLGKVKENFSNHESRIQDMEGGGAIAYPPILLSVKGYYGDQGPAEGWVKYFPNFNGTITGARLIIDQAGSANSTEVDVLIKSGVGSYTSIYSTKPIAAYTDGDDYTSTNQVLDSGNVDFLAGDIIRLDTTSVQTNGHSFYVRIDYTKG